MRPIPRFTGNLQAWANQLTMHLRTLAEETLPVRLRHLATDDDAKPVDEGVLMFQPATQSVVCSYDQSWKQLFALHGTVVNTDTATDVLTMEGIAGQAGWFLHIKDALGNSIFNINEVAALRIGTKVGGVGTTGHAFPPIGLAEHERDGVGKVEFNDDLAGQGVGYIESFDAARAVLQVKGATSQTANLQEWQDSAGTLLAAVGANGNFRSASPSVPATSSSPGQPGEYAWDLNYFYVCVATNTWKRELLSSW